MAEINVDRQLILERGAARLERGRDELVELSNGCICCTRREDLIVELVRLCAARPLAEEDGAAAEEEEAKAELDGAAAAKEAGSAAGAAAAAGATRAADAAGAAEEGRSAQWQRRRRRRFDYVLVESTGISEPLPVAQAFLCEDVFGNSLASVARLDTTVTVVDAGTFARDFGGSATLRQRSAEAGPRDKRCLADLLADQVEFADVLVVNKAAEAGGERAIARLESTLRALNPRARLVRASYGRVNLREVLGTRRFDFERASSGAAWQRELLLGGAHAPESEEYGFASFVYRRRGAALDAMRLRAVLLGWGGAASPRAEAAEPTAVEPAAAAEPMAARWSGVLRSKGFLLIAQEPHIAVEWAVAGGAPPKLRAAGRWGDLLGSGGDVGVGGGGGVGEDGAGAGSGGGAPGRVRVRGAELVFIGRGMDRGAIEGALDAALATEAEAAAALALAAPNNGGGEPRHTRHALAATLREGAFPPRRKHAEHRH